MPVDNSCSSASIQGNKNGTTDGSLSLFDEIENINSNEEISSYADKSLSILGLTAAYSLLLNFFNTDKE